MRLCRENSPYSAASIHTNSNIFSLMVTSNLVNLDNSCTVILSPYCKMRVAPCICMIVNLITKMPSLYLPRHSLLQCSGIEITKFKNRNLIIPAVLPPMRSITKARKLFAFGENKRRLFRNK